MLERTRKPASSPAAAAAAAPGTRVVRGPSALGGDFRRFVELTLTLAVTDFKLRFFGSVLGYVWQLMRPLMLFAVLYVVFTQFVRLGGGDPPPYFALMLLSGIVTYMFFAEATGGAVASVLGRENLVRKIEFPRLAIPFSVVLVALFNASLNFLAVIAFVLAAGIEPSLSWLQVPLLLGFIAVLATGIAMLLSALYVRYRDVQPIWDVLLQVFFYATPILYPLELVRERGGEAVQEAMMLSPLAAGIQQLRHALVDPNTMSAAEAAGGATRLLIPLGIVVAICALGFWVFNREAPRIAEDL